MVSRSSLSAWTSIKAFCFLLSCSVLCNAQFRGRPCSINDSPGTCQRIDDCPSVYEEFLKGNPPTVNCGFEYFDPIVCCPNQEPHTPSVAPTTSTTTTTTTTTTTPRPPPTQKPFYNGRGAKARAKCEEYARSVYTTEIPPILIPDKQTVTVDLCAIKTQKLIVGGTKATPKEFPHMAAVGYNVAQDDIVWQCGGSLISERFVLTAAHCTYSVNWGSATWVRVGDLNLERIDDLSKPQNIRVTDRIRYPGYKRPAQYHDIALLKLEKEAKFNAWVRPICLPYSLPDVGTDGKATATGWGQVDWADDDRPNDLLKVTISLVAQPQCNASFVSSGPDYKVPFGIVDDWQICAGELGKDTCQGDSGGPLAIINKDYYCMYSLIGVTSLGKLCGSIIPGVYSRVYNYIPWIEQVVWPDS